MPDHDEALERLAHERAEADRLYDDALKALDAAVAPRPELPRPTAGFDARRLPPLNESWRLTPDGTLDLGTGWRRRLRGLALRILRPILQRQQDFNGLLVQHLNRNAEALARNAEALAVFQGQLLHCLRRIPPYVDTRNRYEAGQARRETIEVRDRVDGLGQSVALVTAATHTMKREIERRREAAAAPAAPQAAGRPRPAADLEAYKYLCFEDAFRGSREEIAARQREYLAYFEGASDVLDLGCGRGEFLALLREQGVTARGLDANAEVVERCREQDLDAVRGDALEYLGGLADESLGGLFSAQVVEHLEAEYLTRVLAEAQRVLRPGARVVLETINPASWTAFFSAFVRDVTHRHPLHPDTLSYFLRAAGFVDVEIAYRAPVPDAAKLQRAAVDAGPADTPAGAAVRALAEAFNQHVDRLNGLIFAEQDYAAVARRP